MKQLVILAILIFTYLNVAEAQTHNTSSHQADSLYKSKNFNAAKEEYSRLISQLSKPISENNRIYAGHLYRWRGRSYDKLNMLDSTLADYDLAGTYYNDSKIELSNVFHDRGALFDRIKQYITAIKEYDKALESNNQNYRVYISRGIALYNNHQEQLAINDLDQGIATLELGNYQSAVIYSYLGQCYDRLKKYDKAVEQYNKSLKSDPNYKMVYVIRANALQQIGGYDLAVNDYTKALELYKDDSRTLSRIYDNRAICYRHLYKFDEALKDIESGLPLALNPAVLYWNRASLYSEFGLPDSAIKEYKIALNHYALKDDVNNEMAYIHSDMAEQYYVLKDYNKAVEEINLSIALDSTNYRPYYLLGKVYKKHLINNELAKKNFNRVIQLDTSKKSTSYIFTQYYLGQRSKALALLKEDLTNDISQNSIVIDYYNLACLSSLMKDYKKANDYLKKVIDAGYPKQSIVNDDDLDNIRRTSEYVSNMRNQ